ncbi:MAG: hypothetical protein HY817_03135 [Candidatus Abawacabacteria bacterium]|nr:hypothetical protein [Candidatus Abawacabacteria bacterium]
MFVTKTLVQKSIISLIILLFTFALIRTAWIGDDAFITFRTIDNLVNGYGAVWNIGERVQTYTNPLWMLLLTVPYFFSHEIYFTALFLSIGISLVAIYVLLFQLQKNMAASLLTASILLISHAFIDFSTSGLENPLTHLLIIAFVFTYFSTKALPRRRLFMLALIASLAMVNRLDSILLFLPALLFELYRQLSWRNLSTMLLGALPVITWEIFALIYYGFFLPNTYFAKLHAGIPAIHLIYQGLIYCLESLKNDPITLLVIIASLVCSYHLYKNTPSHTNFALRISHFALPLGSLLYILYVIKNGGDFMAGRFFSAPFILGLASLQPTISAFFPEKKTKESVIISTSICLGIFIAISSYWFSQPISVEPTIPLNGIVNERGFFFPSTALVNQTRSQVVPPHSWAIYGAQIRSDNSSHRSYQQTIIFPNIGFLGYFAGPKIYIIDPLGIADPFIARESIDLQKEWRIGHYVRTLPNGYLESKEEKNNKILSAEKAAHYETFQKIIAGPIFAPERWQLIWQRKGF